MPVSAYFKGHGAEVMADMKKRYGAKAGKKAFYATANARGMNPPGGKHKKKLSEAAMNMLKALLERVLTAKARKQLDDSDFALPGRRYPIQDENHARNALARVAQNGTPDEQAKVKAAVYKKYPKMKPASNTSESKELKEAGSRNSRSDAKNTNIALRSMMANLNEDDLEDQTYSTMAAMMRKKRKKGKMPMNGNGGGAMPMKESALLIAEEDWQEADLSFDDISDVVRRAVDDEYGMCGENEDQCCYYIHKLWPDKVVLRKSYANDDEEAPMYVMHSYVIKEQDGASMAELGPGTPVKLMFVPADQTVNGAMNALREADVVGLTDPQLMLSLLEETSEEEGEEEDDDGGEEGEDNEEEPSEEEEEEGKHFTEQIIHEWADGRKELEFKESFTQPVAEAQIDGYVLKNVVILAKHSENGRTYTVPVQEAAVPIFEGMKCYCDHPDDDKKTQPRKIRELIGEYKNVYVNTKEEKTRGDLHLIPGKKVVEEDIMPIARSKPHLIGNSIAARGVVDSSGNVLEIKAARSGDLVTEPATTKSLYESGRGDRMKGKESTQINEGGEEVMTLKEIQANPELWEQVKGAAAEELEVEGKWEALEEENKQLKEEVLAHRTEKQAALTRASIDTMLKEAKIPDEMKTDKELRELMEKADEPGRKALIAKMEAVAAKATPKPGPDPSLFQESRRFSQQGGTDGNPQHQEITEANRGNFLSAVANTFAVR